MLKSTVCLPCNCDTTGSSSTNCDENGICSCKDKFYGPKCRHRDCEVTNWSSWAGCTRCGYTDPKNRTRQVSMQPVGNGHKCPPLLETGTCTMIHCDCETKPGYYGVRCENRDCAWGGWSAWSSCESCGGSCKKPCPTKNPTKSRSRKKSLLKVGNGNDCTGGDWESDSCGYSCVQKCHTKHGRLEDHERCYYVQS